MVQAQKTQREYLVMELKEQIAKLFRDYGVNENSKLLNELEDMFSIEHKTLLKLALAKKSDAIKRERAEALLGLVNPIDAKIQVDRAIDELIEKYRKKYDYKGLDKKNKIKLTELILELKWYKATGK